MHEPVGTQIDIIKRILLKLVVMRLIEARRTIGRRCR